MIEHDIISELNKIKSRNMHNAISCSDTHTTNYKCCPS